MADKLLIGVSAQSATAAHWRGNQIAESRSFAEGEAGLAAFKEYLGYYSGVPVYFVVDAIEEDYRFETLPHAIGRDRADMVGRKLKQHYRNTPYAAAWLLGRESDKRRDDRYLFSALTKPELVVDWLQAVTARGLPVAGIYLLPMLASRLVEKLGVKASNLLLVFQRTGALRLTFFRDRQFRLSRLTRGEGGRADNRSRYYTEEISNTRLYLHALRALTLDEQLTVLLVDRNDDLAEVAATISRDNPSLECVRVGRRDLVASVGIPEHLLDSPYIIALSLLGQKTPESNLAPAAVTVGFKRYQARRAIYAACGAAAVGAAVWAGVNLYNTVMLRDDAEDTARRTAALSSQYMEVTRQFPQAPTSAENLQRAVEIAQKLRDTAHTPQKVMALVSRALDARPNIVIKEFGWKYGTTNIEADGAGSRVSTAEPTPAPVTAVPGAPAARRESAIVEGEIRPFRGDYRSAIVAINGFANRLAEEPDVAEVRVVKLPLNVNPSLSLSGNTLDNPEQTASATAEFKVLLVLKAGK